MLETRQAVRSCKRAHVLSFMIRCMTFENVYLLTLYSSSTQRGSACGVGSSSSICSTKNGSNPPLSFIYLLTDNIREHHLATRGAWQLDAGGRKRGFTALKTRGRGVDHGRWR